MDEQNTQVENTPPRAGAAGTGALRLRKYAIVWLVGLVASLVIAVAQQGFSQALYHTDVTAVPPGLRWLMTILQDISNGFTSFMEAFGTKWPFLWTGILIAHWFVFHPPTRSTPLYMRAFFIMLWLIGFIVLLPATDSSVTSDTPEITRLAAALTGMVALLAIWTIIVFLVYLFFGDGSGSIQAADGTKSHRTPLSANWGVWTSLSLVVLGAFLTSHMGYLKIEARIKGDQAARTMANSTMKALDQATLTVLGDSRDLVKRFDDYVSDVQYYRLNSSSDPAPSIAASKQKLLNDLSSRIPVLQQDVYSAWDKAQDSVHQIDLAVAAAQAADPKAASGEAAPMLQVSPIAQELLTTTESLVATVASIETYMHQAPVNQTEINPDQDQYLTELDTNIRRDLLVQAGDANRMAAIADHALDGVVPDGYGTYLWLAISYTIFVLFPWALLLLFLYRKRINIAAQIMTDLVDLDPTYDLLSRVLSLNGSGDSHWGRSGPDMSEETLKSINYLREPKSSKHGVDRTITHMNTVIQTLAERTFSNFEFVLSLLLLSIISAVGWYFVLFPQGDSQLARLIEQGAGIRELGANFVTNASPLTLGFIGGYFFLLQMLFRRYLSNDLYPSTFLQAAVRLMVIFILSLVLAVTFGTSEVANASAAVVAFMVGVFPTRGFSIISHFANTVLNKMQNSDRNVFPEGLQSCPLTDLVGIDLWTEARLLEENLENVQSMATVQIDQLVLGTHYPTQRIVDWVDEAILHLHAGNRIDANTDHEWLPRLNSVGITGACRLLIAAGYMAQDFVGAKPATHPPALSSKSLTSLVGAVKAATPQPKDSSSGTPTELTREIIYEICKAISTERNIRYIENFYHSIYHRETTNGPVTRAEPIPLNRPEEQAEPPAHTPPQPPTTSNGHAPEEAQALG